MGGVVETMIDTTAQCAACGQIYRIGDSPFCRDAHARVGAYHPFVEYEDLALGRTISSLGDRWKAMRQLHCDYREPPSKGDLSARADRVRERARR